MFLVCMNPQLYKWTDLACCISFREAFLQCYDSIFYHETLIKLFLNLGMKGFLSNFVGSIIY